MLPPSVHGQARCAGRSPPAARLAPVADGSSSHSNQEQSPVVRRYAVAKARHPGRSPSPPGLQTWKQFRYQ